MFQSILIANRGEIAIRIARACADLAIRSVAVHSRDDADALHVVKADACVALGGEGAGAYLDGEGLIAAALSTGCDAIHPGYGFLSENAAFASMCAKAGIVFIGPPPRCLDLFGDKARALAHATSVDVPIARSTNGPVDLQTARSFVEALGGCALIKAVAGGGGRGMRVVSDMAGFDDAWRRCASEANMAFGSSALYVEELVGRARHIEVQILGDSTGRVAHLFERDCSVQRRFQKIIEIAPSPWLSVSMRERLIDAALRVVSGLDYIGLGTVEFLVEIDERGQETGRFIFIEMNPRLQVEHTVTEEITGVDLVQTQIRLAAGERLDQLGVDSVTQPNGYAIQLRVNMEEMTADGIARISAGALSTFELPSGSGVRIETAGYRGYTANPNYDSLLAKLIVRSPSAAFTDAVRRAYRALCEFNVGSVQTSLPVLQNILRCPEFEAGLVDTRFVEAHAIELCATTPGIHPGFRRVASTAIKEDAPIDDASHLTDGLPVRAPMRGRLLSIEVEIGDRIHQGQTIFVIEAMKMEHSILAEVSGTVTEIPFSAGDSVRAGTLLAVIEPGGCDAKEPTVCQIAAADATASLDLLLERRAALLDEARPAAVEKQRDRGALTARERIALLSDAGSFMEFGSLVHPEHVSKPSPADGVIAGTAKIDGRPAVVFAQDFTVFGGSAGHLGSAKVDRAIALALSSGIPLVMLLDGGGHRIQDGQNSRSYAHGAATFHDFARLSGWAPVVVAVLGAGFAANTNYAGLADFVVMLKGRATMGLAGPALVRAGTGEDISAQALGGASVQVDRYGLADLSVDSEQGAIDAIRSFLSYLPTNAQARTPLASVPADAGDPVRAERLLGAVPANTRRNYDVLPVIASIADPDSVYEIKPTFARNIVTTFARLDGRPVGFIANQALHAGGMLDSPACEKAARFVGMCDAFGLPLIYLIDVPGFSIGSEAEKTTLGRRSAKLIYELGHATVPRISVVLRKGYGLGYVAMGGGRSFDADASLAWPTAEICAMSVEGSVDVAYRADYERAADPQVRRQELIDSIRSRIGPIQAAEGFGIDEVIDPRTTRARLIEVLERTPPRRNARQPPKYRSISPI